MSTALDVQYALQSHADSSIARNLSRYFKIKKGEYGYGDTFLGIKVPTQRRIAKQYKNLSLTAIKELIASQWHECRLTALFILVYQYTHARTDEDKQTIVDFYLDSRSRINNWDLVDSSAPYILGDFYTNRSKDVLYSLAHSKILWERRIAIMSTFGFIKNNDYHDALKIATILLHDKHDLIHKAVGWMLREIGKRDEQVEREFLDTHCSVMPRTMLRYAIEKFEPAIRMHYLTTR